MAGEPIVEFVGRLVRDPDLNRVASGTAVVDFAVAVTPRIKNQHTDAWEDGTPLFFDCSAWRDYAEHIAATYRKGTHVWVRGRLVDDSYERDGQTIRRWKVDVDETGPTLRFTTATLVDARANTGAAAPAFRSGPPPVPGAGDPFAPPF